MQTGQFFGTMSRMKLLFILLGSLVLLFLIAFTLYGLYRTFKTRRSPNQRIFLAGSKPNPLPDGFYHGSVTGYSGSWRGKKFDSPRSAGINVFGEGDQLIERYPFKTYSGEGLQDQTIEVLKIDYNIPTNPFWVRLVLDEIVQVEPGKYLGKVHYRFIPIVPFTIGYFRLEN